MFIRVRHVHFVGIGGIGMSGIAEVLVNLGYVVTGSDMKEGATVRRLRALGAHIALGHDAANVQGAHVVVISSAIPPTNPEVQAAHAQSIPVIPRAEMLAELMRLKYGLAVAGAHGKTTTTSMLANILTGAGLDPTVVIGGRLSSLGGSNAKLGEGNYLVAEADESDGSFLLLYPTVAVVTNIDPEHLDHYGNMSAVKDAFVSFINKVPFYGAAVVCIDNPGIREILPRLRKRLVTYGVHPDADLRPEWLSFDGMQSRFTVCRRGRTLGQVRLAMPGMHNVLNAVGALGAAMELEVPFDVAAEALEGFSGVGRRFQLKGEIDGITVVDDYAHHPTEIRATLSGVRQAFGDRRVIAVYQPHRYTRTRDQMDAFPEAFSQADELLMTDIYPAGEAPIEGITGAALCQRIQEGGDVTAKLMPGYDEILAHLEGIVREGDVLITMGAGDVWRVSEEFLESRGSQVADPQG